VCGNGDCELDENASSCPGDCDTSTGSECGNGVCDSGESAQTCPSDCRQSEGSDCGDGVCEAGETSQTCAADCGTDESPVCGNGRCESTESSATCPSDCGSAECTTAACVEDRCIDGCDTLATCGVAGDELADCYDNCLGWDPYYDDWLDPRVKRSDCYAALGALFGCNSASSCEELNSESACVRELAGYERECPEIPRVVDVTFLSVLMGAQSPDGCQWDGIGCTGIPQEPLNQLGEFITEALAAALGVPPIFIPDNLQEPLGAIVGAVVGGLFSSIEPPDIFGTVSVHENGLTPRTGSFGVTNNSYQANMGPMVFRGVGLDTGTFATLDLYDQDLTFNDPVGPVNLDRDQFLTAWTTGGNAWVLVARRPQDPVLQVQMRVDSAE
jgi:hypothetical protein